MSTELDLRIRELLHQAAEWRLLGLLFERPRGDWWGEVASLARSRSEDDVHDAARAAAEAEEGPYLSVLGPGGPVSPREVGHRPVADPGHLLAELAAYYRAFGYEPRTEEPPDHVSVEVGFVGYLRLKQAYALARGEPESAAVAAEAAARFVDEHVACVAEPLAQSLEAPRHLALAGRALFRSVGPRRVQEAGWVPQGWAGCREACGLAAPEVSGTGST